MRDIRSFIKEFKYYKWYIVGEISQNRIFNILMKMETISCDKLYLIKLAPIFYSFGINLWHIKIPI